MPGIRARFSGSRLVEARECAGMRREEVALRVGRSVYTVASWERGDSTPTAKLIERLADVLGVDPGDLFEQAIAAHV